MPKGTKKFVVDTGSTYRFRINREVAVRLLEEDRPRVGLEYELTVGDKVSKGRTADGGWIKEWVPPDEPEGALVIGKDERYRVELAPLPPVSDDVGVRVRLHHLGFLGSGEPDAAALRGALVAFQGRHGLEPSGELDDATRSAIEKAHGC